MSKDKTGVKNAANCLRLFSALSAPAAAVLRSGCIQAGGQTKSCNGQPGGRRIAAIQSYYVFVISS